MPASRQTSVTSLLLLAVSVSLGAADDQQPPPSTAEIRKAVERSLPYLEKAGLDWIETKDCHSCHTVSFMLWSHNVARSRGIAVDEAKLAEWTEWSANRSLTLRDDKPAKSASNKNDGDGVEAMAQLLLGRDETHQKGQVPAFVAKTPALIAMTQGKDGRWKAGGQLPRQLRPAAEADAVNTRWIALALGTIDQLDLAAAKSLAQALDAVKDRAPGKSIETLITSLLVTHRFGKAEDAAALSRQLIEKQNPDGGWAWLEKGPSDAFATGQALYALSKTGTASSDQSIAGARRFLISTQQEDGTWPTTGDGISQANTPERKKKVAPIYKYWGTAWASIGLATSLPMPEKVAKAHQ